MAATSDAFLNCGPDVGVVSGQTVAIAAVSAAAFAKPLFETGAAFAAQGQLARKRVMRVSGCELGRHWPGARAGSTCGTAADRLPQQQGCSTSLSVAVGSFGLNPTESG